METIIDVAPPEVHQEVPTRKDRLTDSVAVGADIKGTMQMTSHTICQTETSITISIVGTSMSNITIIVPTKIHLNTLTNVALVDNNRHIQEIILVQANTHRHIIPRDQIILTDTMYRMIVISSYHLRSTRTKPA